MENKSDKFNLLYAISLAWQLGFMIVVPIGGFALLGWWGDKTLKTSPFLFLVGIIIGIISAFYNTYRSLLPLIRDKHKKK